MATVPALCNSCYGWFATESLIGGDVAGVTFVNCEVGPCPHCGGTGSIPDGTYDFIGDTIKLLSGPSRTIAELNELSEILRRARKRGATADEIKAELNKELPELSKLSDALPKTRTELYAFIGIILAIITLLARLEYRKEPPKLEINQVINNITQEITITAPPTDPKHPGKSEKVGRNQPCPCGSGKKYKRCHGK